MKPILFNTEMVRAILDNRKTVTRRVVKPQEKIFKNLSFGYTAFTPNGHISVRGEWTDRDGNKRYGENFIKLPYCPGDLLYVRETWCQPAAHTFWYKADSTVQNIKWRPSIHMPREAARIFLRVTDVRVERLQDISDKDLLREGEEPYIRADGMFDRRNTKTSFIGMWNSTLKPKDRPLYGWAANPWVWVVAFEKVSREEAENGTH